MWLLTCDGDLFGGQPIWLRPGSGHLLGRTSGRAEGGEVVRYINHKSVSRKHAIIHVGQVKPGDSAHLLTRSEVKITDGSKVGTYINGEKISQTTKILDKPEYTIKLGNYEHTFHLKWQPVVLTFSSLPKSAKARSDPLEAQRRELEQADVKLVTEYITNKTTHVIGKRRNIPLGLQALVQGRWLVTDSFVGALAKVTTRPGPDTSGNERPCPLEEDFTGNWPEEYDHVPAAGKEPNPKANEYLRPNPQRAEVFAHLTFIFLSQAQYDLLMPVVTSGSGKALLWDVEVGVSKADGLVDYVKEVAGLKRNGASRLSQTTGKSGIIVVRLQDREEQWTSSFLTSVELALEQRSMEQNQFLDAILSNDASELRKPLGRESQSQAADSLHVSRTSERASPRARDQSEPVRRSVEVPTPEPVPDQTQPKSQQSAGPTETMQSTTRRKPRRLVTESRFKGFEEVDPSQFTRPESDSPEPSQAAPDLENMQVDEPAQVEPTQQTSRKRPAPVGDDDDGLGALMDDMLQGAAAMKKRKLQGKNNGEKGSAKATPEPERSAITSKKLAKKTKQMDVRAELEARREQEDEERRKEEEKLRQDLENVDISGVHAKVESYELPQRQPPRRSQQDDAGPSDRWDPAWNGRKNFKRFQRKGQSNEGPRLQRVMVSLEEVPRKGHGIGDEYWLQPTNTSTKSAASKSSRQTQTQTQTQSQTPHENGDDDPARFRRRIQNSRREDEEANEMLFFPDEMPAGQSSRNSSLRTAFNATPSQTAGTESQRRATGKRPATQQDGPAPKKVKQSRPAPAREVVTVDDDDDDGLKFRRRRR
ncbi:hypothetical protein Q7P37_007554 [Cladosporium fusiforme]